MGIPYNLFLIFYVVAFFAYGAMTQAHRRTGSLYGRAYASIGIGRYLVVFTALGQIAFLALAIIGFLSLRWYLVLAIFLVSGGLGGILYTMTTLKRDFFDGAIHNIAAGTTGIFVTALTIFLWAQRLLH